MSDTESSLSSNNDTLQADTSSEESLLDAISAQIRRLLGDAGKLEEAFELIVLRATELTSVTSSALILCLDQDSSSKELEVMAQSGENEIPIPAVVKTISGSLKLVENNQVLGSKFIDIKTGKPN